MSSLTSRAPESAADWQQQPNSKNSTRQSTPQRPTHSQPTGSKAQHNYTVTSFPLSDVDSPVDTTNLQAFDEHDSWAGNTHTDGKAPQSNVELPSQFFSYGNYLTPDHGSENPFSEQSNYTSPSIDDFIWQETYNTSNSLDDFVDDGTLVNTTFDNIDQTGDLQGIVQKEAPVPIPIIEPRSLTPRMPARISTMQTPEGTQRGTGPVPMTSGKITAETSKRSYSTDDEDELQDDRSSRSTSNQKPVHTTGQSMRQVVKPTVLVSTYNRGDSPARTTLPMARSLSKRSQSSRLSEHEETVALHDGGAAETVNTISRLMPPNRYGESDWAEDDDNEPDRAGVAPTSRNNDTIQSLNDMDKQHELDETRVGVENWLATSETGSPTSEKIERSNSRSRVRRERMRSRSTGGRGDGNGAPDFSDKGIPGPGALLTVDSEDDYSDDGSLFVSSDDLTETATQSPPAEVEAIDPASNESYFPTVEDDAVAPDESEPLPRQFYRKGPWQDPFKFAETTDVPNQPATSNHAIMQYDRQAAKFETASRAATWGTRRRLSDSEIASIVDGSKVRHLSLSNKARDRGSSFINRARTVIRRSSSNVKKSKEHLQKQSSPPNEPEGILENDHNHTATSPIQQVQRTFSWGKSKSPPLTSTGGALMAMTGHLAAVGGSTAGASVEPAERPKSPFFGALKRSRSKSDLPKASKTTPGLSDLWNRQGGPPVPTLASPMQMRSELPEQKRTTVAVVTHDDDMDEDNDDEVPVKMELPVQAHKITPTLDGFRTNAKQLNPRLEQYLIERIAQDQLRRYKKLVKNKIDHTRKVQLENHCSSGAFCVDLGGKPNILPPRTSAKDANVNYAQFKVGANGESDGDEAAFVEGIVTPALFPSGIPLPPATHLPAEFECPLCFQVKKFQKPSDWTKHVHEDVQPFSCTFPNCPEPKSFKRKADWVRHENERHRHLEWWRCSIQECAHICYRKDNFVQHLVREHKMTEPKAKSQKPTGNRARPAARSSQNLGQDADDFWQLVEHCRHDTSQTPRNEPCKFCGNICSTWKKLSVHVGKHMEQIAMPVLELAAKRAITADTIISPIESSNQRVGQTAMLDTYGLGGNNFESLSPHTASAVSVYQSSSAGQSPVPINSVHAHAGNGQGQVFYNPGMMPNGVQPMHYANGNAVTPNYSYPTYDVSNAQNYIAMASQTGHYTQQSAAQGIPAPYHPQQVPRSQPMDAGYGNINVDTMQGGMYNQEPYYPHSASGNRYLDSYENGMGHNDGLHSPHHMQSAHPHSPAAGLQPNGNGFNFTPHQHGANGRYY